VLYRPHTLVILAKHRNIAGHVARNSGGLGETAADLFQTEYACFLEDLAARPAREEVAVVLSVAEHN
jgi:hypothetical protein